MAAIADGIELFLHIFSKDSHTKPQCESSCVNSGIGMCYVTFAFVWLIVWTKYSDKDPSTVLTLSSCVQLLAFLLLTLKVRATKSVAGISSKSLELYVIFFTLRLGSTCTQNGYLPVDRSGQFVYQLMDALSLALVVQILYCIHKTHKYSYQAEQDTLPILPFLPPCAVLGFFVHAGLSQSQLYDTMWATSMNVDTVAMIPQLWMMSKIGGQVHGCTAHFVATLCASRCLTLAFWVIAYNDLVGVELAAKQIVCAHVLQLLLSADFLYYYVKASIGGKNMTIAMPTNRDCLQI